MEFLDARCVCAAGGEAFVVGKRLDADDFEAVVCAEGADVGCGGEEGVLVGDGLVGFLKCRRGEFEVFKKDLNRLETVLCAEGELFFYVVVWCSAKGL